MTLTLAFCVSGGDGSTPYRALTDLVGFCSVLLHKAELPSHTNKHGEHPYRNTVVNTYLHYSTGYSGSFLQTIHAQIKQTGIQYDEYQCKNQYHNW